MPVFTFEKLSPPAPVAIAESDTDAKPRGKMGQLLDRLVGRSARKLKNGVKPFESGHAGLS